MKPATLQIIRLLALIALAAGIPLIWKPAAADGSILFLPLISAPPSNAIANCPIFPADNIWNTPIDRAPVDPNSDRYIASMDDRWDNEMLNALFSSLQGSNFEAVDVSGMQVSPDSGQAR